MKQRGERRGKGLFWDRAWKLVEGCSKVSPGCDNCWSEMETIMRRNHPNTAISDRAKAALHLAQIPGDKTRFDGRVVLRTDNLDLPLRTKKPTVWAIWNDLYHENVPDDFRDKAYVVMALCPQHTFLVITKRAERMAEYFSDNCSPRAAWRIQEAGKRMIDAQQFFGYDYPLPNVWHSVTAENQQAANERIPHLLKVPGKRFVSIEPMLGPVDILKSVRWSLPAYLTVGPVPSRPMTDNIHAVLLGGESGPNARPMHPDWARAVRDQCADAEVPFFFKQWGEFITKRQTSPWIPPDANKAFLFDGHPASVVVWRVGKKKAGRLLDGKMHNDLPWDKSAGNLTVAGRCEGQTGEGEGMMDFEQAIDDWESHDGRWLAGKMVERQHFYESGKLEANAEYVEILYNKTAKIEVLKSLNAELLAMLEKLEWKSISLRCLICNEVYDRHAETCKLGRLLKKARG